MKNFYSILLCLSLLSGLFYACDDDDPKFDAPTLQIISENGTFAVAQDDSLTLKVQISSDLPASISWTLNDQVVSTDSTYKFQAKDLGKHNLQVKATSEVGETIASQMIEVYGKYKYGTFILNEGQLWQNQPGTLVFINPKGKLTDSVYYRENNQKLLGSGTQDLFIHNKKMYIVAQGEPFLIVLNAETLKEIKSYKDELIGKVNNPTHVAVLTDDDIYLRNEQQGIKHFNPRTGELITIEGTTQANKTAMAVADGKVFAVAGNDLLVIEKGKTTFSKKITATGPISGVIRSSDGNIWYSCSANGEHPAKIVKLNAKDYSTEENPILEEEASKILSGGFFTTPYISAKADTIYMCGLNGFTDIRPIYRHIFSQKKTQAMGKITDMVENVMTLYNSIAVHPITGEIYANTIKSYGHDPDNKINIFHLKNDNLTLKNSYKGHTLNPAGIFFTYNFE